MSRSTQLTLKMFLSGAAITMGIASCFALWNHLAAEREMKALIDEENKALLEEGLKWYLPKGSEIIELCTDCKCENKLSCNDEKIVFNSYQPSQTINLLTDYRSYSVNQHSMMRRLYTNYFSQARHSEMHLL